ncbi:MAG: flagellar FliJ family protein [Caulobacterales bacterium]|jgi:flagellar export protein FliJ
MRALPALQRIARADIDAIGREIATLMQQITQVEAAKLALQNEIVSEQAASRHDLMALRAYAVYAPRAAARVQAFEDEVRVLQTAVTHARERLSQAMAEQKKLERLQEILAERASRIEAAIEQAELDETAAILMARRKKA